MNLKKILLVLFLPLFLHLISGCCNCEETMFFLYGNCDLEIISLDNSGIEPVEIDGIATVNRRAYGIRTRITRREDLCLFAPTAGFISTANATSCDCPPSEIYEPRDTLVSLKIFTVYSFDDTHPPDSEVTEYFRWLQVPQLSPTEDFLPLSASDLSEFSDFTLKADFLLTTPPVNTGVHQFRVETVLSDNRVLSRTTSEIALE